MGQGILTGGGETGTLIRAHDWSACGLGPIDAWPAALRTIVGMMLSSRHPMFLWWGPDLIQFYNDAYLPSFGVGKHPAAMGQRGRECWGEIWPIIGPQIEAVMTRGEPSWNEDALVPIFRNGVIEEVFWTYGYSPVFSDDGSIGGTLVVCTETTARVVADRRTRLLRTIADTIAEADEPASVIARANLALATDREDVPFALWFARPHPGDPAVRTSAVGLDEATAAAVAALVAPHLGADAVVVSLAEAVAAGLALPGGPWSEPSTRVFVVPLRPQADAISGYLVVGLSPRLPFDDPYRQQLLQLGDAVVRGYQRLDAWRARLAVEAERNNLLAQAPIPIAVMVGPEHRFELVNPAYSELVRRDLIGKTYREAFPERVGSTVAATLDHVYRTGEPYSSGEHEVPIQLRGPGADEERYVKYGLEPIRDAHGQVYGMMAIAADITEQVRARQQLERVDSERGVLLAQLEAANRSKDEFLAMLGHELRNPLSPIVTAIELMKMRDGGTLRADLAVIDRQVQHLTRLVDDLLDVSRIARGSIELRREHIEIAIPIARALETATPMLERARHVVRIDVPAHGLEIDADPMRMAQVIANLLTNAAKYTPPGGHVTLTAGREGTDVVVRVRDDGVGIEADMLPHVFDLFTQVRQDLARSQGGLGLGLAIVKNLVELHGGTVAIASPGRGGGTELTVRMPAVTATASATPGRIASSLRAAAVTDDRGPRVLVVDDNTDAATLLADALEVLGYAVTVAHDGPSAIKAARAVLPSIAVLDIGLPVMDGYELGRQLRATPELAGIRLIALSGYGTRDNTARSDEAGFHAHLVKPVSLEVLTGALTSVVAPDPD